MLGTLKQWVWGNAAPTPTDPTHHVDAPVAADSIYASIQNSQTAAADTHAPPIHLAALSGEENPIEKAPLMLSPQSPLHALVKTRDTLIQKLRASENYHPTFERLINKLVRLGDESLDSGKASRYTERVNTILQAILDHPTFHTYCMRVGVEGEKESSRTQDEHFIHSQAIKTLIFLEDAFRCDYLPPQATYQELIERGKQTWTWKGLIRYIHADKNVLQLQEKMAKGQSCQLDVSILYAAQVHLTLPIIIEPLDDLVAFPPEILVQALSAAKAKTEDPFTLYQALYTLPFWRAYIYEGYKQDITAQETPLAAACISIGKALNTPPETGKWCTRYPDKTPEQARDITMTLVFVGGMDRTIKQSVQPQ